MTQLGTEQQAACGGGAGVYNRLRTEVGGRGVDDEHLVNAPNWLPLRFRLADGDWVTPDTADLLDYRQELDLRHTVLTRVIRIGDAAGRTTRVTAQRLVSQDNRHLAALRATFEVENWSGPLRVRSTVDGRVVNAGAAEYRPLANRLRGATSWLTA